jgi:hypothetical protein
MGGVGNSTFRNDVWYTSVNASSVGRVTDATTNAAIACATVVATSTALSAPKATTADLNGDYRLDDLPSGSYIFTAYAPGHASKIVSATLGDGDRAITNFAMAQTSLSNGVRGIVTDAVTHAPIPGIHVVAKIGGNPVGTAYTCAEGNYEILGLAVKTTSVTVEFSGDAYSTATQTVSVTSGTVVQVDKALGKSVPAPGALAGTVVRSGTVTAIAGARVTIEGLGDINTTTDSSGTYAFSSLPEGSYSVRASAAGYGGQTQLATVAALGTSPLDFDLPVAPKGDINQDSAVNATDVQLVINAALSVSTPYNCDVSKDGAVNAIDVQQVINAALGL